jgi:26S proteasome regulatory subunit N7
VTLNHLKKYNYQQLSKEMAPYYRLVTSTPALTCDETLLEEMDLANTKELAKLDERLAEAEKTEGESEISDALKAKANYLTRIGDKVRPHPSSRYFNSP